MQGSVRHDTTTRVITVEVREVADIDATRSWHQLPRVFRPDHVTIHTVDGELKKITASGPLVLKSGAVSASVREDWSWYPAGTGLADGDRFDHAPDWVRTLAEQAPNGVTSWASPQVTPL
jgi:hypothetical protein